MSKLDFNDCQMDKASKDEIFGSFIEKMSQSRDFSNGYVDSRVIKRKSNLDATSKSNLLITQNNFKTF